MTVTEIKEGEVVLARHIPAGAAWGEGLKFFSQDEEYIQVGTWGYGAGKQLLAHTHNPVPRQIEWTKEVLYVRKGSISASIYDTSESKVATLTAGEGDILILLRGGHGYTILEDGTEVLEVKNGPYPGAEADRRRLQNP
jgi:hypothetical protein